MRRAGVFKPLGGAAFLTAQAGEPAAPSTTAAVSPVDWFSDPSFLLTATGSDFDTYFPTYLANGYLSTMTGPRATESNLAYLVAFMDYTKEHISRPPALPP